MNDQDYIRAGVELADGWRISGDGFVYSTIEDIDGFHADHLPQALKDALAAQLVRQVDAIKGGGVLVGPVLSCIYRLPDNQHNFETGDDRTMNTIKAIVDSGVLK